MQQGKSIQPGLQEIGPDGHVYDVCQTTGILMRLVETATSQPTANTVGDKQNPGMLSALHHEINSSNRKSSN